jgi:uncharacterized repeat protein (TIGR01451 family)
MKKYYYLIVGFLFFGMTNAQIANISNTPLKNYFLYGVNNYNGLQIFDLNDNELIFGIDVNQDGQIQISEALQVKRVKFPEYSNTLTSLSGIEYFTNLEKLDASFSFVLSANVNLSALVNLKVIWLLNTPITGLDVHGLTNLTEIDAQSSSGITSVNLSNLPSLTKIFINCNNLQNLDLGSCPNLAIVYIENNGVSTNYNFPTSTTQLGTKYISFNILNNSSLNNFVNLNYFNSIAIGGIGTSTTLDFSNFHNLTNLTIYGNSNLTSLNIKNGTSENFQFYQCPNLKYICVDDSQYINVSNFINQQNLVCNVNSYCSFTPGGDFYTVQGNSKYDLTNNGCDVTDINFSNLKLDYSGTIGNGILIPNSSGSYSIPVQAGTHTITPVLENPNYFSISPASTSVDFPTTVSPANRDFCITANGVHNDLEITSFPINTARPGFDAKYKIIYKNKGTNSQSGTINLAFNDAVLDLVTANPASSSQTINNLNWSFTNLLPFETREILVTLNLNSPTETPAVNVGFLLNYTTTITAATDETPLDNSSILNQTVVNSIDPNDKTCLEGATISPSQVGKEVHYIIRFENNGTANAQNIVVKDMIDTTKFDVNSIIPTKGSHSFVTRITETNKVEFIFENINLPFNDANNDGYIAFKIKTKPSLVLGDTFSNTASIYFDYNFPIVTNPATTTVANVLSNQDFEFASYFTISPNPAKEILNINSKENIAVSSISIYNTLGQLVQVIPNAKNTKTIDVSNLKSGTYFVKVISDKGASSSKFVKE